MEPGPSGSSGRSGAGGGGGSSVSLLPERAVQQILNPIPGPSNRPYLAQPIQVPPHFLVPPEQLLPHQIRSGIDIGNLFKLLNALQNRIALACGQHQFLRDPLNQPRPPEDGGYKPLTPQAAVRDIRSLCRQQKSLMEKLRRWNCTNDGKCYDLVMSGVYTGICNNCEPFAASEIRMKKVDKTLQKQKSKAKRKSLKKLAATAAKSKQQAAKKKVAVTVPPAPAPPPLCPPPSQPSVKKKKKYVNPEPPHPDTFLTQENFLSKLGLVTPEVYLKTQAESRRTERRRRTTANPKYKTNAVADTKEAGKCRRSRRSDPSSLEVPQPSTLSSPTGAERRRAKQKRYECTVCEKKNVTIQCTNCLSGFHPECILVTASKASPPSTVTVCPNCVPCNPNIRSSDCILLSRRMSRPSIMGLKSDPESGSSGNHRHPHSSRNQKGSSRRRATTKSYSKVARRKAAAAKSKQPSFKPQTVGKPRKTTKNSRKCYSKRTLNHSLAVAAAAAVPAYCTSSVETTPDPEKACEYQTQRKRKLDTSSSASSSTATVTASTSKLCNSKQANTTTTTVDRRAQCAKREISPSTQLSSSCKIKEVSTAAVKKASSLKPLPLVPSDERSNCILKKQSTKPNDIQDGIVLSQKNSPSTVVPIQDFHAGGSKTSALAAQQKVDVNNRLKKTKLEKMEENIIPMEPEVQTSTKGANSKNKKCSGTKPGSLDPFCMKRTMMAMSAAAGIVLSNSGIKITTLSNTSQPPASPSPPVQSPQTPTVDSSPAKPSISPPDTTATTAITTTATTAIASTATCSSSCNTEINKSMSISTETKMKAVQKSPKPTTLSPLGNLNTKYCEKEDKKLVPSSAETAEKSVQKVTKAASTSHLPMETFNNDLCWTSLDKRERSEQLVSSGETTDKTTHKSIKFAKKLQPVDLPEEKLKTLTPEAKEKNVQKLSNSPVCTQSSVLKNKCKYNEKVISTGVTSAGENLVFGVQNELNILPSSFSKVTPLSKNVKKLSDSNEKFKPIKQIVSKPPPATSNDIIAVKSKPPEIKKTVFASTQQMTKAPRAAIMDQLLSQRSNSKSPVKETPPVTPVTPVTTKAKRTPRTVKKMSPAMEQSVSDTISRVILEASAYANRNEENAAKVLENKKSEKVKESICTYETTFDTKSNTLDDVMVSSSFKWRPNLPSDDYSFSYTKYSLNTNQNSKNELERPSSPTSNSSTIGSPRSLGDLDSDSDDLLSIPDTSLAPYIEFKRLERPSPFLDFTARDDYKRNLAVGVTPKRGRGRGRGRGGRR